MVLLNRIHDDLYLLAFGCKISQKVEIPLQTFGMKMPIKTWLFFIAWKMSVVSYCIELFHELHPQ